MDDSQRTVLIDDSHNVGQIIKAICARINLSNPDEFSLTGVCMCAVVRVCARVCVYPRRAHTPKTNPSK